MAHPVESVLLAAAYIFLSFFFSYCLGFVYGVVRLKSPLTRLLNGASWLRRWFGVAGLLGERPMIYEVLNPELAHGVMKSVFVEIEMKGSLGFYSGQLDQFAIVRDEEPHKPIFLIDVWFKKERSDEYTQVATDGLMIDLADAATLLVQQVDETEAVSEPEPTQEEIASLAKQLWVESGCRGGEDEQNWLRAAKQLRDR